MSISSSIHFIPSEHAKLLTQLISFSIPFLSLPSFYLLAHCSVNVLYLFSLSRKVFLIVNLYYIFFYISSWLFLFYLTLIFSTSDSKSSNILHVEMVIMCLPSIPNSSLLENKLLTLRLRKDYPTKLPQIYLHLYYKVGKHTKEPCCQD